MTRFCIVKSSIYLMKQTRLVWWKLTKFSIHMPCHLYKLSLSHIDVFQYKIYILTSNEIHLIGIEIFLKKLTTFLSRLKLRIFAWAKEGLLIRYRNRCINWHTWTHILKNRTYSKNEETLNKIEQLKLITYSFG